MVVAVRLAAVRVVVAAAVLATLAAGQCLTENDAVQPIFLPAFPPPRAAAPQQSGTSSQQSGTSSQQSGTSSQAQQPSTSVLPSNTLTQHFDQPQHSETPPQRSDTPPQHSEMPPRHSFRTSQDSSAPSQQSAIPQPSGTPPQHYCPLSHSDTPLQHSNTPRQESITPQHSNTPRQEPSTPQTSDTPPQESNRPSQHPDTPSQHPNTPSQHSNTAPQHPHSATPAPIPSYNLSLTTTFSLELFKRLASHQPRGSLVLSPLSVWVGAGLAGLGAAGTTLGQVLKVLGAASKVHLLATYRAMSKLYGEGAVVGTEGEGCDLLSRVYLDLSAGVRPCVSQVLHPDLATLDFSQADQTASTINHFVNSTTRGRIPQLVQPHHVSGARGGLLMTNAAFFRASWQRAFLHATPRRWSFKMEGGGEAQVDMMAKEGLYRVGNSSELGATVLELPYKGGRFSMYLLLPVDLPAGNVQAIQPVREAIKAHISIKPRESAVPSASSHPGNPAPQPATKTANLASDSTSTADQATRIIDNPTTATPTAGDSTTTAGESTTTAHQAIRINTPTTTDTTTTASESATTAHQAIRIVNIPTTTDTTTTAGKSTTIADQAIRIVNIPTTTDTTTTAGESTTTADQSIRIVDNPTTATTTDTTTTASESATTAHQAIRIVNIPTTTDTTTTAGKSTTIADQAIRIVNIPTTTDTTTTAGELTTTADQAIRIVDNPTTATTTDTTTTAGESTTAAVQTIRIVNNPATATSTAANATIPTNTSATTAVPVVLPLDNLVQRLGAGVLDNTLSSLHLRRALVTLPAFTLRSSVSRHLTTALSELGMTDLFSARANLTAFSPGGGLRARNVVHEAVIEVNEEGSTATAATAILVGLSAHPPPLVHFTCDRPFVFLIKDKINNNILFIGAFREPPTPNKP